MSSFRRLMPLLGLLGTLMALQACRGYRFVNQRNPLAQYGIKKLAVPMFVNLTIYPHISGPFTQEVVSVLNQYPDLRVYPGEYSKADAILVGVLSSPEHRSDAYRTDSNVFISGDLEKSIYPRRPYYLPLTTGFKLNMHIVVIKDPTWEDLQMVREVVTKGPEGGVILSPKVVINQALPLNGQYGRQILSNLTADEGGVVNATKNEDAEERTMRGLAESAGRQFSELVLNVF